MNAGKIVTSVGEPVYNDPWTSSTSHTCPLGMPVSLGFLDRGGLLHCDVRNGNTSRLSQQAILPIVTRSPVTVDISGKLVFLGTGTSVGVPAIGCGCEVCRSENPKNRRTRTSVVLGLPGGNLLIDTSPDLRFQLLREGIGVVHAVLYTHDHADHVFGLDDLRLFPFYLGHPVPLYCDQNVEARIRKSFDYAFSPPADLHQGGTPQIDMHSIGLEPFKVLGSHVVPMRLLHGPNCEVLGFRFGNVAYCTDTNGIPEESLDCLGGLDILILDALRRRPHATHFHLEQAVQLSERLRPKRTFFTHMSHELEHEETNASLPEGMELAYDGLQIPLS